MGVTEVGLFVGVGVGVTDVGLFVGVGVGVTGVGVFVGVFVGVGVGVWSPNVIPVHPQS